MKRRGTDAGGGDDGTPAKYPLPVGIPPAGTLHAPIMQIKLFGAALLVTYLTLIISNDFFQTYLISLILASLTITKIPNLRLSFLFSASIASLSHIAKKKRRGVGALVGAVFLVLIMASGFVSLLYMMNIAAQHQDTVEKMQQLEWERNTEAVYFLPGLGYVNDTGSPNHQCLNLSATNDGPRDTRLIYLGLFNTTEPSTAYYYPVDAVVKTGGEICGIGLELPTTLKDPEITDYGLQLITDLGNVVTAEMIGGFVNPGGVGPPGPLGEPGGSEGFGFPNNLFMQITVDAPVHQGTPQRINTTFRIYAVNLDNLHNITNCQFNLAKEDLEGIWDGFLLHNITLYVNDERRGGNQAILLTGVDWIDDTYVSWNMTEQDPAYGELMPHETWYFQVEFMFTGPSHGVALFTQTAEAENTSTNPAYCTISVK